MRHEMERRPQIHLPELADQEALDVFHLAGGESGPHGAVAHLLRQPLRLLALFLPILQAAGQPAQPPQHPSPAPVVAVSAHGAEPGTDAVVLVAGGARHGLEGDKIHRPAHEPAVVDAGIGQIPRQGLVGGEAVGLLEYVRESLAAGVAKQRPLRHRDFLGGTKRRVARHVPALHLLAFAQLADEPFRLAGAGHIVQLRLLAGELGLDVRRDGGAGPKQPALVLQIMEQNIEGQSGIHCRHQGRRHLQHGRLGGAAGAQMDPGRSGCVGHRIQKTGALSHGGGTRDAPVGSASSHLVKSRIKPIDNTRLLALVILAGGKGIHGRIRSRSGRSRPLDAFRDGETLLDVRILQGEDGVEDRVDRVRFPRGVSERLRGIRVSGGLLLEVGWVVKIERFDGGIGRVGSDGFFDRFRFDGRIRLGFGVKNLLRPVFFAGGRHDGGGGAAGNIHLRVGGGGAAPSAGAADGLGLDIRHQLFQSLFRRHSPGRLPFQNGGSRRSGRGSRCGRGRSGRDFLEQGEGEGRYGHDVAGVEVLGSRQRSAVYLGTVERTEILDAASAVLEQDDGVTSAHCRRGEMDVAFLGPADEERLAFRQVKGLIAERAFEQENGHKFLSMPWEYDCHPGWRTAAPSFHDPVALAWRFAFMFFWQFLFISRAAGKEKSLSPGDARN